MILLLLALLALTCPPAEPQAGASRLTLVTVTDARNQPIVDLTPDDVVIREGANGKDLREILSVHTADYPVVVLIDTGAAARVDFPQIRRAVARFVDRLGRRPIAIGTIGSPPALVTSFDDPPGRVLERLERLEAGDASDSVPLQAAAMAAKTLSEAGSPFSAIVVVSATDVDGSAGRPEELIGPIIDGGAIVQVVANRAAPGLSVTPVPAAENDRSRILHDVVRQTLGQFTTIYTAASYQAALDRLADRMSNELMIEYLVPAGSKPSDVKVGVRIPGARVRGLGVRPR